MGALNFRSRLAPYIIGLIEQKRALGDKYTAQVKILQKFDMLCAERFSEDSTVTKAMLDVWAVKGPEEAPGTLRHRVTVIAHLAQHIASLGFYAYIYPTNELPKEPKYNPYIFSGDELTRFFRQVDCCHFSSEVPNRHMESNEDEFKDISEQIEQLNRRIAAIQDSLANDMSRQERLEQIQKVIEQREQNSDQYHLALAAKSYGRCVEAIKFYLALKHAGLPVIIYGAEFIKKRLLGLERVGIVPNEVMPFYCHSRFPGEDVDSFRHLNHENPDAEIALIEWQPIKPVKLKENAHE